MFQDYSNEHVQKMGRGFVNRWWPFKSGNVPIEWLHMLSGLCQFHVQLAGQWIACLWYQPLSINSTRSLLRITNHLATVFWLPSGMAITNDLLRFLQLSRMASGSISCFNSGLPAFGTTTAVTILPSLRLDASRLQSYPLRVLRSADQPFQTRIRSHPVCQKGRYVCHANRCEP